MLIQSRKVISAAVVSALAISPIATAGLVLTTDVAFAKSAKKPEKEKKARTPRKETHGNGHGAIASKLGNLNAVNSLRNGQGYLNTGANSNVGMIAAAGYAMFALGEAETTLNNYVGGLYPADAVQLVNEGGIDCSVEIELQQCVAIADYEVFVVSEEYAIAIMGLGDDINAAKEERNIAYSAIGTDELSDPAREYFEAALTFVDFKASDELDNDIADASLDF